MFRKWISLVGAACMMMAVSVPANAAGGTVRVIPQCCGQDIAGGRVSICQIGTKVPEGYRITDGLANWIVTEEDILSSAVRKRISPEDGSGIIAAVEKTGAVFSELSEGAYLISQEEPAPGYQPFTAFAVCITADDSGETIARPKLIRAGEAPDTSDHPAPIIGAMGVGLSAVFLMILADERKK